MRAQLAATAAIGALAPLVLVGSASADDRPDGRGGDHEGRHDARGDWRDHDQDRRDQDRRDDRDDGDRRDHDWRDRDRDRDDRDRDSDRDRGDRDDHFTGYRGEVTDLDSTTDAPTDGVQAGAFIVRGDDGSVAGIRLTGFDSADAGTRFGAHVHTGPCVADDPDAAGEHYNDDTANGREPARVSPETEVWFDLTVDEEGTAKDASAVPFVLPEAGDGIGSIVLHEETTDDSGDAGGRTACIPLA